jgi:hypothetical protein
MGRVQNHLRGVWKRALSAKSKREALENIAEMEWFIIRGNPASRGAKSRATLMSGLARKERSKMGEEHIWERHYDFDHDAIVMPLWMYKEDRVKRLLGEQ